VERTGSDERVAYLYMRACCFIQHLTACSALFGRAVVPSAHTANTFVETIPGGEGITKALATGLFLARDENQMQRHSSEAVTAGRLLDAWAHTQGEGTMLARPQGTEQDT
jgi:hypothetical protein